MLGYASEALARARDRRRWPFPGRLESIGGHGLHVRTFGDGGDVPIVFEADEGAWSTHWGRLPEDFGAEQPTVAYDRAGLGWSGAGPPPRDAETLARELHQLLTRLFSGQPAVLVGHGTGAHVLRAYAHRYPFETAGLVLVDPRHDGFVDRLRREQIPAATLSPLLVRVNEALASFGILRLVGFFSSSNGHLPLPKRQRQLLDALELDPKVRRGAADELSAEADSLAYLANLGPTADVPMRILVSTETLGPDDVPPNFPRHDYNRVWSEESACFLDLSKRAQRLMVEGSGHQLQLERPEVVAQAILDVVDEARELRAVRDNEPELRPSSDPSGDSFELEERV